MRKKIFSALMLGLLIAGTAGTVTSCKDYDEDINGLTADNALLKSQLESLKADLSKVSGDAATNAALQTAVSNLEKAIAEACKCESDNGLKEAIAKAQGAADAAANLAKENKEEIEKVAGELAKLHGEDLVARLGQVEAAIAAQNAALAEAGVKDFKDLLDTLNKNIADALVEVKKSQDKVTEIEEKANNLGKKINETDEKYDQLIVALARDLRSLVFMPNLYLDGIETLEYAYLEANEMSKNGAFDFYREPRDGESQPRKLISHYKDYTSTDNFVVYGPAWPVEYHMNPSNSKTAYADIVGFTEREAEVVTRVKVGSLGITSPEKYHDGTQLFKNEGGVVTAGIQIKYPHFLQNNGPKALKDGQKNVVESETGHESFGYDNIIALQAKTQAKNLEGEYVTSDYAMLAPEEVAPKAIVWSQSQPAPSHVDGNGIHHTGDENCPDCNKFVKVYDNPEKALKDKNGATILLEWDDKDGLDIKKYIATHYSKNCRYVDNHDKHDGTWKYGEEKKWGLHYEFDLVEYEIDSHKTIDSRYVYWKNNFQNWDGAHKYADEFDKTVKTEDYTSKDIAPVGVKEDAGILIPCNVKAAPTGNAEDGLRIQDMDMAASGREPLVRVRLVADKVIDKKTLKVKENVTVLDGYILVRITKTRPSLDITEFDRQGKGKFDLCNGLDVQVTTWSQFSKWVLTDELKGMVKKEFELQYKPDFYGTDYTDASGNIYNTMNIYNADRTGLDLWTRANGNTERLGTLYFSRNEDNTTNHAFVWSFTEEELEYLTHGLKDETETVDHTMWVRFKGVEDIAKYRYLWVKFTVTLNRKMLKTQIDEKNKNYWFKLLTGEDDGYQAVALNLLYPQDVNTTQKVWSNELDATFVKNKVNFTKDAYSTYKYFFVPVDVKITDQSGAEWTITAKENASDLEWNKFIYHYDTKPCADDYSASNWKTLKTNDWNPTDYEENKKILDKCAIDYNKGCFSNDKLYARSANGVYTLIAVMDQSNGNITLVRDGNSTSTGTVYGGALDCVLNAVGYKAGHAMLNEEMRTWVGVVANNGCDVAVNLFNKVDDANNPLWVASWERPINMVGEDDPAWDAQSNGNIIYLFDNFKFFDWRYQTMEGTESVKNTPVPNDGRNGKWLWAYYNIYEIEADIKNATTDMHGANFTKKLTDVSKRVHLWAKDNDGTTITSGILTFNIPGAVAGYPDDFSQQGKSAALIAAFEKAQKNKFGYLYYENNGENVEDFTVRIPVVVKYEWGHFRTTVDLKIQRTQGN